MLQPLKNKILIQRDEAPTETAIGLFIPETAQKKETTGTILAIGNEVDEVLKTGQKVLFGRLDGYDVDPKYCDGRKDCILIKNEQVRLIFNA